MERKALVVVLDENGSVSLPVEGGTQLTENLVGAHFPEYDGYLVLSHFKGHAMAGFGGAIKNISIGLGSQEGKCLIHTAGESHTSPWGGEQDPFTESMAEAGNRMCQIEPHHYQQLEALNTVLPVGNRQVSTLRTMLTRDIAALLPFHVQELQENGVCYGINQVSHNLCIANRKNLANGNGMVFGIPGSGKSYFSKSEMLQVFLGTEDDIIVIDPTLEYFDIAEALGNQAAIVNLSTYTKNYINPLEMDVRSLDLNDSQGQIRDKGEFMLGLCEQCCGDSLNSRHKSIIDRCVRKLYTDIAREEGKAYPDHDGILWAVDGTAGAGSEGYRAGIGAVCQWFPQYFQQPYKCQRAGKVFGIWHQGPGERTEGRSPHWSCWKISAPGLPGTRKRGKLPGFLLMSSIRYWTRNIARNIYIPFGKRYGSWAACALELHKHGGVCIPFDNRMEKEENPIYALFNTNLHEKARNETE